MRMPRLFSRLREQPRSLHEPDDISLRSNLSFVLHERSDSAAVSRVAASCRSHAAWLENAGTALATPHTTHGSVPTPVDAWLTAHIGLWMHLEHALTHAGANPQQTLVIDGNAVEPVITEFFRAPARLSLPRQDALTVGVAVLIARPGRQSSQLELAGPFSLTRDTREALRALERCIQRNVEQWLPLRALWDAPAEVRLSDEIR